MKSIKKIPYGPTYPPLTFNESNWEKDLELMAKADMDIVRVGDIGTWERIEVERGIIDLERLQRFYTLAAKYDIHVLLSTGTSSPPLWLAQDFPDVRIKSNRGELYPLGASYHWACVHHPAYQDASERYINELSKFAVKQPNHFGWQISNEIGFPFNPTRESGDIDLYCYCDHSKLRFQEWLEEKYGDIDRVTESWAWSTTNFVYKQWSDLFPPEALPKTWSSVTRWLDWRVFWQQAFTDHAAWEHSMIRVNDPDHPTSINTFNFKGYDRFGVYTGLDQWKKSEVVDHIGYDLYPGSGHKLATRPEHSSMFLDHGRSVSYYAGSDFWIHEIESGPIGGWLLGPDHKTGEKDILNMCFETLGHDAKLLIYMPWREWLFQPLRWGALVDLQINPTPRYDAAALVGRYIKQNSSFLKKARVQKGEIALLESKNNATVLRGMGQEDQLFQAQRGAYRAFWEKGFRVDFISEKQLLTGKANDYKVICLPLMGLISVDLAQSLKSYVKKGGVLVGFARCGTLDEKGWYHPELPIPDLGDVFGIDSIEADHRNDINILLNGHSYRSWINRDVVYPRESTEILAKFEDGLPAVTLSQYGKGFGIYLATQADGGYLNPQAGVISGAIELISNRTDLSPAVSINYDNKIGREIDPHILDTPERTEILVTNYSEIPREVDLSLVEPKRKVLNIRLGIIDQKLLDIKPTDAEINISFKLDPKEVQIISIDWQ